MADTSIKELVPGDELLPHRLHVIPLSGAPIFPGLFTPIMISSPEDIRTIKAALEETSFIGLIMLQEEDNENPAGDDLCSVGTAAKVVKSINLPDGGMNLFISTVKRFRIRKILHNESPIVAAVDYLEDQHPDPVEEQALTRSLIAEMKQISENNPLFSEEMRLNMVNINQPGKIADFITSILHINRNDQQDVLETLDIRSRLEKVLMFIKKEQEVLRIQKRIQGQINEKIEKSQREYFLREELKAIKQELGIPTDSKGSDQQRFQEAFEKTPLDGEARETVQRELEKFSLMDSNSSEFIVTRNYLETVFSLPWDDPEAETIDIGKSREILDSDHYGLDDVKERILEFLAVRKLQKDAKGGNIILVGPPGVGKTSIGKSVARALGKEFFRFSVGGMRDEAEIKGHRRTYVGAMPGKIIQGLKIVHSKAPVFMIDEIDKLGMSYQGDPSSALLEVLDPEQNVQFRDHYLDIPFDLSNILFIATANSLDNIPRPLLDRMEVIRLSGYIEQEKVEIAKKYIIPKSARKAGLTRSKIRYPKKTLQAIAEKYAREAGMRNYEKLINKIHRKIALQLVEEKTELPIKIEPETLSDYLGKPVFEDDVKRVSSPGMAIGLAWTNFGGDTLVIEAIANPGKSGFTLTGQMGKVMQESAGIAYSYVRSIAGEYGVSTDYFEKHHIHLHIPAGATPKDGPSAGITMALALLSLATGRIVKKRVGMTGELSLVGQVLPIGGLKEKVIAARRNGIKTILFPDQNLKDLDEIPDYVQKGISFHPVRRMQEVLELALAK
ncbi:endopeptidase La [Spirochaeta africana]|uniref:Lon protease n=1 Tax=Spirochaeta africana (strain ATCC 700263 / DSM 8902 / Z-7692) TaxID=889378 RepID=H9UJ09_SPIAZ|nr:endopeptidase La [Spirochaeta africana]AFG37502.1 ATP-dependent protease La [Spirochaeta africana DSM 8902]